MPNFTVSKFLWLFYLENKGDGSDAEASTSEEDLILQDEICKSRLASIKRVQSFLPNVTIDYTNCAALVPILLKCITAPQFTV